MNNSDASLEGNSIYQYWYMLLQKVLLQYTFQFWNWSKKIWHANNLYWQDLQILREEDDWRHANQTEGTNELIKRAQLHALPIASCCPLESAPRKPHTDQKLVLSMTSDFIIKHPLVSTDSQP